MLLGSPKYYGKNCTMETRERVLRHLKRRGATSVAELAAALRLSPNAVRHHLLALGRSGAVSRETAASEGSRGRPATRYTLTLAAEDAFPKRYPELLSALLAEAERQQVLVPLLAAVAERLAAGVRPDLQELDPRARLLHLLRSLDYGDMLPTLTVDADAWRLVAHNCLYREAGLQVEGVCDLLPRVIELASGLPAERIACLRDGLRACTFSGSLLPS
jgi:predicted ArsR family transcriptional regulator